MDLFIFLSIMQFKATGSSSKTWAIYFVIDVFLFFYWRDIFCNWEQELIEQATLVIGFNIAV